MAKKDVGNDSKANLQKSIEELLERKKNERQALMKVLNFFEERKNNITIKDKNQTH